MNDSLNGNDAKKILSFFGALVLAIFGFAAVAGGIMLITQGNSFNGVSCIVASLCCFVDDYLIYRYFQNRNKK